MSKSSPSPSPQCCEEGHCSQQVWNVRPSRKGSSAPDIYIWWGPPWLNQEHDHENHYEGLQEYLVYKNKKEPKEAVDDALVSVWQRIVALITPWNAKLDWSLLACCCLASQSWLKTSIRSFKTKKNHDNTDSELNITLWELINIQELQDLLETRMDENPNVHWCSLSRPNITSEKQRWHGTAHSYSFPILYHHHHHHN